MGNNHVGFSGVGSLGGRPCAVPLRNDTTKRPAATLATLYIWESEFTEPLSLENSSLENLIERMGDVEEKKTEISYGAKGQLSIIKVIFQHRHGSNSPQIAAYYTGRFTAYHRLISDGTKPELQEDFAESGLALPNHEITFFMDCREKYQEPPAIDIVKQIAQGYCSSGYGVLLVEQRNPRGKRLFP